MLFCFTEDNCKVYWIFKDIFFHRVIVKKKNTLEILHNAVYIKKKYFFRRNIIATLKQSQLRKPLF